MDFFSFNVCFFLIIDHIQLIVRDIISFLMSITVVLFHKIKPDQRGK